MTLIWSLHIAFKYWSIMLYSINMQNYVSFKNILKVCDLCIVQNTW
jgi:hypothetical protein